MAKKYSHDELKASQGGLAHVGLMLAVKAHCNMFNMLHDAKGHVTACGCPGRPADVDPARREQYLSESDFQRLFGMSMADFQKQPKWKQQNAKSLGTSWPLWPWLESLVEKMSTGIRTYKNLIRTYKNASNSYAAMF